MNKLVVTCTADKENGLVTKITGEGFTELEVVAILDIAKSNFIKDNFTIEQQVKPISISLSGEKLHGIINKSTNPPTTL